MNLLIFSPVLTHPQNEGNCKRIYTLTKYLQELGHTIHFVYFTQNGLPETSYEQMRQQWDSLTIIEKTKEIEESTEGYKLDDWYQEDIHPVIREIVDLFSIDAVLVNYLMQSKLLEYVPDHILKIIDTHDIFADRHLLFKGTDTLPYTWYSISKEDEIRGLNRADIVLAIQEEEAKYFTSVISRRVEVVNHVEDRCFLDRSYHTLRKIGFIGFCNQVNDHAIHSFLEYYLKSPLCETTQIVIAGFVSNMIRYEHPSIIRKGGIKDIESFYKEVDLVINPALFGTGLKIKTIEALSYGIPVVSTLIGFEGIRSSHPCHTLATAEEMVVCIEEISQSGEKLAELANESRTIFKQYENSVKTTLKSLFHTGDRPTLEDTKNNAGSKAVLDTYNTLQQMKHEHKREREISEKQTALLTETQEELQQCHKMLSSVNNEKSNLETKLRDLQKSHEKLLHTIRHTIHISALKHPLKKYKSYKEILSTYDSLK